MTVFVFIAYYGLYAFNLVTMLYGINKYFFHEHSPCNELHLFIMVLAHIFGIWLLFILY